MAELIIDDYEFGPNGSSHTVYLAASQDATVTYVTAAGKFKDGTYGLQVDGGDYVTYEIPASAEFFLSVFAVPDGTGTGKQIIWLKDGVELGSLRWDGGKYNIHVGTDGTPEASGTTTVAAFGSGGALKNYQLRVKIGDTTTGSIQFKLDDVLETDYDAQDTKPGTDANVNQIKIGNGLIIDDLFVNDTTGAQNNTWPGIVRMETDRPTGDSTVAGFNQWSGSGGGVKANLINGAVDPASYVFSDTPGQIQSFSYAAPCVPPGSTIKAVTIYDLAYKVSAGDLKQGLAIGETVYPSATKTLTTTIAAGSARAHHAALDPSTGSAWLTTKNPASYLEHV